MAYFLFYLLNNFENTCKMFYQPIYWLSEFFYSLMLVSVPINPYRTGPCMTGEKEVHIAAETTAESF